MEMLTWRVNSIDQRFLNRLRRDQNLNFSGISGPKPRIQMNVFLSSGCYVYDIENTQTIDYTQRNSIKHL